MYNIGDTETLNTLYRRRATVSIGGSAGYCAGRVVVGGYPKRSPGDRGEGGWDEVTRLGRSKKKDYWESHLSPPAHNIALSGTLFSFMSKHEISGSMITDLHSDRILAKLT